jgi:glycogen debranching enzyme
MSSQSVSILDGSTFVVSDRRGDIDASPSETHGLFRDDTRFLSTWILTLNDKRPNVLSVGELHYYEVQYFLAPSTGTVYVDSPVSVIRRRSVHDGFQEDLSVINHTAEVRELRIRMEADADFADLFEIKDVLAKKGKRYRRVEGATLILGYQRQRFVRETRIWSSRPPEHDGNSLLWKVSLPPHGEWSTHLSVDATDMIPVVGPKESPRDPQASRQARVEEVRRWQSQAPRLSCSWRTMERTYERSVEDLAALRYYSLGELERLLPGGALPAAGLPWFMAVFGRDSLITALQSLPYMPDLSRTTLQLLSEYQGATFDSFRDEEPGKILHELRRGEMTAFEERPHSPYFGTADATPLFLVLLDEYERWNGDSALVRDLEFAARRALEWINRHGDRDGDGYIEYERRNTETGLENHCWKDSWDSIRFADGRLAKLPRATCELQGYAYDAKIRCARLARQFWKDPALADRLEAEAADLKQRFNKDFWIPDKQYFALALDGDKKQVDSLTSNIGHLLWSGIVDSEKAAPCVRHLLGERLFSGWGVRTMAEGDGYYNPIGYHVGTVWPHDNSIIAWGLWRYGYRQEAAKVALAMLEASQVFQGRLPEAFAGYPRSLTRWPVEYPTACSPQAWATGAPMLFIRTLFGLDPVGDRLLVDPALPERIQHIELLDIPGRWGHCDAFGRSRVAVEAAPSGIVRGAG